MSFYLPMHVRSPYAGPKEIEEMWMGRLQVGLVAVCVSIGAAAHVEAQERWQVHFENGVAIPDRIDVRIPGDSGTRFSMTDDLAAENTYFWRVRADVRLRRNHVVSALAAPLRIDSSGVFDRPVFFAGETFEPGTTVRGRYVFNSYRLTYRWEPVQNQTWQFGFGVTAKIRDAVTRLESGGRSAEKTNVGFVPLVNFRLERRVNDRMSLLLEGDALAAPQGRAEDVFAGVLVHAGRKVSVKAGYRLLEGGADNDEVYTFALFHYAAAGVVVRF